MNDELLFGGLDPLCDFSSVFEILTEAHGALRESMIDGLAEVFRRAGMNFVDANRLAHQLGKVARREALAQHFNAALAA